MSSGNFIVYALIGNPAMCDMVYASASSAGLRPLALHSADEYLRQPESSLPTCLILGVDLPDMSGPDLQARIARTGAAIVFVSDRVDLPQSVRAIKAGAVDFLTTPIDPAVLSRAVHTAIELDRSRRVERRRLADLQRRYRQLTPRECQVFPLLTAGLLNKQVASMMGISPMTVQIHRGKIMRKMGARSFADLVRFSDALSIGCELTASVDRSRLQVQSFNGDTAGAVPATQPAGQ